MSFKKQLDDINKHVASKMTALQQKQHAVLQLLRSQNEKKDIDTIKERISALT